MTLIIDTKRTRGSMTAADMQKVVDAGLTIIRRDYARMTIKIFSKAHAWTNLERGFDSKANLDRRAEILLRSSLTIEA